MSDVEATFEAALREMEPAEFSEQGALLDAEERNGGEPEPARTVNVHFEEEADLREFESAVGEKLHLTTESFWYAPDGTLDAAAPLAGEHGMEFGPAPDEEEDDAGQGNLFGEEREPWERHWRGMPAFEQEDLTAWKTITVKFLREKHVERFREEVLGGEPIYHGKWTWFPFQPYKDWTDKVWVGGPQNKYPIFVPSRNRADVATTPQSLDRMGADYRIVVEPDEVEDYAEQFGRERLVVLPEDLPEGLHTTRTWIKRHCIREWDEDRHWQIDDNIEGFYRLHRNAKRLALTPAIFRAAEEFSDRYRKVGLSGLHYESFAPRRAAKPPYYLNTRIYSCTLVNNEIPHEWETRFNDDTDITLRVLKDGWRTVLFNAFLANKAATMTKSGGLTEDYEATENRYEFARSLKERHEEYVEITKKWGRWHHHVDYSDFQRNRLEPREGVDPAALPETDEMGMELISTEEREDR